MIPRPALAPRRLQAAALLLATGLAPATLAGAERFGSDPTRSGGDLPPRTPRLEKLEAAPVAVGEQIRFRSEILSADVTMRIAVPESFAVSSEEHTYPVAFLHGDHGRQFFPTVAGLVKHLADRERMPESIVVSLDDLDAIPQIHTHGMWGAETLGPDGDPAADLRHLEEEVIPYLERTYRANHYRLIVGVSGSSLFPIYTFTEAPDLFDSHILVAAADMFGMGYRPGETFVDAFEAALAATPTRRAKLYVGVADADLEGQERYRSNLEALESRLRRFAGLDLEVEVFPREDHYAVLIRAMLSALDQNFPDARWSARYRDLVAQSGDALDNIDRYYEELSREYGFRILPRADRWNNVNCLRFMIRHLIQEGRTAEAVAVAERRAEYRPGTLPSLRGLVDAYEADGRLAAAVAAQKRAVAQAEAEGHSELSALEERLQALRTDLAQEKDGGADGAPAPPADPVTVGPSPLRPSPVPAP